MSRNPLTGHQTCFNLDLVRRLLRCRLIAMQLISCGIVNLQLLHGRVLNPSTAPVRDRFLPVGRCFPGHREIPTTVWTTPAVTPT